MTVVLACAHRDFAFLAADSVRWDLVQRRNLGPVEKIHLAGDHAAVAIGGTNVDRTVLGQELVAARASGEGFPAAARRIAPRLFAEKRALMANMDRPLSPRCAGTPRFRPMAAASSATIFPKTSCFYSTGSTAWGRTRPPSRAIA
jgi:hypothetical protein